MFRKGEHKLTGKIHIIISLLLTGKYEESNLFSSYSCLLPIHFKKLSKDVVFYIRSHQKLKGILESRGFDLFFYSISLSKQVFSCQHGWHSPHSLVDAKKL